MRLRLRTICAILLAMTYQLIDHGEGEKLEQIGSYLIRRPCQQAVWPRTRPDLWKADASFDREKGWIGALPDEWVISYQQHKFLITPNNFGNLGLFFEHALLWSPLKWEPSKSPKILNLFAYTGAATIAFAKMGAQVCHVDASKKCLSHARKNAEMNGLGEAPIRYICDDALKFIKREIKRGQRYDGILLDPPTFGRGPKQELFKIEDQCLPLINSLQQLLSDDPLFFIFSSHTPGWTPLGMELLFNRFIHEKKGVIKSEELFISSPEGKKLPSGCFGGWYAS